MKSVSQNPFTHAAPAPQSAVWRHRRALGQQEVPPSRRARHTSSAAQSVCMEQLLSAEAQAPRWQNSPGRQSATDSHGGATEAPRQATSRSTTTIEFELMSLSR